MGGAEVTADDLRDLPFSAGFEEHRAAVEQYVDVSLVPDGAPSS